MHNLLVETVPGIRTLALVVALKQDYAIGAESFVGEEERGELHTSFTSIHVVPHEDILKLRRVADQELGFGKHLVVRLRGHLFLDNTEERDQVEELSMQVPDDHC